MSSSPDQILLAGEAAERRAMPSPCSRVLQGEARLLSHPRCCSLKIQPCKGVHLSVRLGKPHLLPQGNVYMSNEVYAYLKSCFTLTAYFSASTILAAVSCPREREFGGVYV